MIFAVIYVIIGVILYLKFKQNHAEIGVFGSVLYIILLPLALISAIFILIFGGKSDGK